MTLEEKMYFRQKMLGKYGPGWEEIVEDYKQKVTPRYRPATDQLSPHADYRGWNNVSVGEENFKVDPTRFRTDNPLSLLSSKEDIDAVLKEPTKQDYINELDQMAPNRLQGPAGDPRDMMRRPWSEPPRFEPLVKGFQNRISPLPHQLEGPETAIGPMMAGGPPDSHEGQMEHRGLAYDPNQELYDQNYYGTAGQMGQMGSPSNEQMVPGFQQYFGGGHPDELPVANFSGQGHYGYDQFTRRPPGLLGPDDQISEVTPTNKGGKWEKTSEDKDSIFRRDSGGWNRRLQGYKGIMDLGASIAGRPTKWRG
tara:strand:+ start:4752 stop:5678 length:927 start_codon:yes stop_codon:yes gene_type:complete